MLGVKGCGFNYLQPDQGCPRAVPSRSKSDVDRIIRSGVLSLGRRGSRGDNHALSRAVSLNLGGLHEFRNLLRTCCAFRKIAWPCVLRLMTLAMTTGLRTILDMYPNLPPTRFKKATRLYLASDSTISLRDGEWFRRAIPRSQRSLESRSFPEQPAWPRPSATRPVRTDR